MDPEKKVIGKVKWWNDRKGFGFIDGNIGRDIFVHYTEIELEGHKSLTDVNHVKFQLTNGVKGPMALKVEPLYEI